MLFMTSENSHYYHIRIHGFREVWCASNDEEVQKEKKDILRPFMEQPERTKLLFLRVYCKRRWEKMTLSNSKKKIVDWKGRADQRKEERRIKFVYLLFYTGLNEDELRMNQTEWIEWNEWVTIECVALHHNGAWWKLAQAHTPKRHTFTFPNPVELRILRLLL